jgi:hypothetical protein
MYTIFSLNIFKEYREMGANAGPASIVEEARTFLFTTRDPQATRIWVTFP